MSQSDAIYQKLSDFIDQYYIEVEEFALAESDFLLCDEATTTAPRRNRAYCITDFTNSLDTTFATSLRNIIIAKKKTPAEVYKKAGIDRKLWSKIQNNQFYTPSKRTAVAFALALELGLNGTKDLLKKAGYTLSRSNLFDVIIEYCLINKIYNFVDINDFLRRYDQPLL